jgi:hypothetical protein
LFFLIFNPVLCRNIMNWILPLLHRSTCTCLTEIVFIEDSLHKGKGKVKLPLHINWASCHEGVLGSGGIALCMLDLGTRWRCEVSFTPWLLYLRERAPGTHWIGGWVDPRAGLDTVVRRKIPCTCWDLNPQSSSL